MRLTAVILVLATAACAAPAVQHCHRYDALSLTRENGFAASLDWKDERGIDRLPERVDVAMTIVPPLRGPIEIVHVVGDAEADRWALTPPDVNNVASSVCWITPPGVMPNCGATLQDLPFFPGGYYYLRGNGNTVLEAGLAFYVCD
jgi:hypothetical protein